VAQKRANGFGLFDTLGNVWEWVNDWYDANYYQNSPYQDPRGLTTDLSAAASERTDGQGFGYALLLSAHPLLPKAINVSWQNAPE